MKECPRESKHATGDTDLDGDDKCHVEVPDGWFVNTDGDLELRLSHGCMCTYQTVDEIKRLVDNADKYIDRPIYVFFYDNELIYDEEREEEICFLTRTIDGVWDDDSKLAHDCKYFCDPQRVGIDGSSYPMIFDFTYKGMQQLPGSWFVHEDEAVFGTGFGTLKEATDSVDAMDVLLDSAPLEKQNLEITLYDEFRQTDGYGDIPKEDVTATWDGKNWVFTHDINKKGFFVARIVDEEGYGKELVTDLPTGKWKNGPLLCDSDDDSDDGSEESDSESSES